MRVVARGGLAFFVTFALVGAASADPAPATVSAAVPFDGVVLARGDRVPLAGVSVSLDDGALSAVTGEDGRFAFPAVRPGPHAVHLGGAVAGKLDLAIDLAAGTRTTVTWYVARAERYSSTVRGR